MRNEINLTDDQIEDLFEEAFSIGLTIDNLDFTRDTIDNFVSGLQGFESWNKPVIDSCGGFQTLEVSSIKVAKGKPKQDLQVIDFGTVRAVSQSNC
jgi:queuine/archaeosine tRNA-ribosyltransferase